VTTTNEGISSGVKYRFKVTAVNAIGESEGSTEVRYTAAPTPN
jgi:hypothetical protein